MSDSIENHIDSDPICSMLKNKVQSENSYLEQKMAKTKWKESIDTHYNIMTKKVKNQR